MRRGFFAVLRCISAMPIGLAVNRRTVRPLSPKNTRDPINDPYDAELDYDIYDVFNNKSATSVMQNARMKRSPSQACLTTRSFARAARSQPAPRSVRQSVKARFR